MKNSFIINCSISLIIAYFISSCNSMSKVSRIKDKDGNINGHHISYDASRRGSLIYKGEGNKMIMLSEPPPDVATKLATDLGAKVKINDQVDASLYMSTTKSIAELGKRTASVNMLRDALYKLSEMRMSNPIIDSTTSSLFKDILKAIENMHKAEMEAEKTKQDEAKAEKAKAQNEQILLNNNFIQNEALGAKKNYQIAIQKLLDQKLDDAKIYFQALYNKYPIHFNIDEINKELKKYDSKDMNNEKWKGIYQFLYDNSWGIDLDILEQINKKR